EYPESMDGVPSAPVSAPEPAPAAAGPDRAPGSAGKLAVLLVIAAIAAGVWFFSRGKKPPGAESPPRPPAPPPPPPTTTETAPRAHRRRAGETEGARPAGGRDPRAAPRSRASGAPRDPRVARVLDDFARLGGKGARLRDPFLLVPEEGKRGSGCGALVEGARP